MQRTIAENFSYSGIEPFGGQKVNVTLHPASPYTGVVFWTSYGRVPATLDHASQHRSSVLVSDGKAGVLHVEHFLAMLFAHGVDNCEVEVKREPDARYAQLEKLGLASTFDVLPLLPDREKSLCARLSEIGTIEQDSLVRLLIPKHTLGDSMLTITPWDEDIVRISALTEYPHDGKQSYSATIDERTFAQELARSRSYAKHVKGWMGDGFINVVAKIAKIDFGYGHGFLKDEFFIPVNSTAEWRAQERYPAEIARHSVVDRLGALALLSGRLSHAYVVGNRSGHAHDLQTLKANIDGFVVKLS